MFGKTVMNGDMGMGVDEEDEDHLMLCDSCGQSIVGVRYQCLSCPGKPISYNLVSPILTVPPPVVYVWHSGTGLLTGDCLAFGL